MGSSDLFGSTLVSHRSEGTVNEEGTTTGTAANFGNASIALNAFATCEMLAQITNIEEASTALTSLIVTYALLHAPEEGPTAVSIGNLLATSRRYKRYEVSNQLHCVLR